MSKTRCIAPVEWDETGPCEECGQHKDAFMVDGEGRLEFTREHEDHGYEPPVSRVCGHPEENHQKARYSSSEWRPHCSVCDYQPLRIPDEAAWHAFVSGVTCPECEGLGIVPVGVTS